jgi:hypothetical protein
VPVQRGPAFVYPEMLDAPCKIYPGCAAGHFLHRIRQCAVTIRCQRLQGLKRRRTAENDAARQDGAPGIGEAKERTDEPIRGGSFAGGGGWFGAGWRTLDGAWRGAAQR